jgi:hypothetical protein
LLLLELLQSSKDAILHHLRSGLLLQGLHGLIGWEKVGHLYELQIPYALRQIGRDCGESLCRREKLRLLGGGCQF